MPAQNLTSQQALEKLISGNSRYADARQRHPRQSTEHRQTLVEEQNPFAVILSCSDSRVPSELIFDQGLGDLFIVRTAGHAISEISIASVEFAVYVLKVPLIMVVGHAQCGAVSAALKAETLPSPYLNRLASSFKEAVEAAKDCQDDCLAATIRANAQLTAKNLIAQSRIIAEAVAGGMSELVPAYYHLDTGLVEILER